MNKKWVFFPILILGFIVSLSSCGSNESKPEEKTLQKPKIIKEFGFTLNDYEVVRDTVQRGDTFGTLLKKTISTTP